MKLAILFLAALVPTCVFAQYKGADLKHGPHKVGFKVIQAWDHSRTYYPKGGFVPSVNGETGKPMQILVWYPAEVDPAAKTMAYGVYVDLTAWELGKDLPSERQATLKEFIAGPLRGSFQGGKY